MLNKESYVPYYLQIYCELKNRIESMVYKPDDMLPSENELVEEFNVTRVTVRNAIKKLKDEGKIRTEKGKGSYVNHPKFVQNLDKIYTLGRDDDENRYNLEHEVIDVHAEPCSSTIQKKLQLATDELVVVIRITRKLEGIPVVIQTSYLPISAIPGITYSDVKDSSIYNVLENKYNTKLLNAKEYIDPMVADEYYSKLLDVEIDTPLFITERITYTDNNKPIEFRRCVIRSDKFRFSVELQ